MKKTTITYEELAKAVGSMVLFNNATASDVDDDWYNGLITQPLLEEKLAEQDKENGLKEEDEASTVIDIASECYQVYAITQYGAEYLFNHTAEVISYSEKLGIWLWHIGHWGTAWSHVHVEVVDYDETPEWYSVGDEMLRYKWG